MFSTVDSLDARYVKIYLVAGDRSIPAIPPPSLGADYLRVQALPTRGALDRLVFKLGQMEWIDAASAQHRFLPPGGVSAPGLPPVGFPPVPGFAPGDDKDPAQPADGGPVLLPPGAPEAAPRPHAGHLQPGGPRPDLADLPGPGVRSMRALERGEPLPPGARILGFQNVRLEVWRMDYEPDSRALVARKMASALGTGRFTQQVAPANKGPEPPR